jgi:hypothetical protein
MSINTKIRTVAALAAVGALSLTGVASAAIAHRRSDRQADRCRQHQRGEGEIRLPYG